MGKTRTLLLSLFSLLSIAILVESSPLINITIGSSLSAASPNQTTSYWLSPSGIFAFGFYPLCTDCNQYIVGIWFVKSSSCNTLVWTANRDDPPLSTPSSLLLNHNGMLVLRIDGVKEKPLLLDLMQPASYALMLDSGNFVLYNSDSQIIWESFDYPTDTILANQTLKSMHSLFSSRSRSDHSTGKYELRMQRNGKLVLDESDSAESDWEVKTWKKNSHVKLKLDSNGHLYLVGWNDLVLLNLTAEQQQPSLLYRATLDTDGIFRLYGEKAGCEIGNSVVLWDTQFPLSIQDVGLILCCCCLAVSLTFFCPWGLRKLRKECIAQSLSHATSPVEDKECSATV